jgi:hypothetical protein
MAITEIPITQKKLSNTFTETDVTYYVRGLNGI